jgi:uncharacterized protein YbcI
METTLRSEHETALATLLRAAWEQAHGAPAGKVHVLLGPESVAAWIEDVLSPAERAVAMGAEGHELLQRYTEQLLGTMLLDLQAHVEGIMGRFIVSSTARADMDTGYVLCFFVLGEPFPDAAAAAAEETGHRS